MCFFLSDGRDWPTVIKTRLSPYIDRLWINNAGLDGHSSFGHQRLIEQYVAKLRPKVVLLPLGANDVGRPDDFRKEDRRLMPDGPSWNSPIGLLKSLANYSEVLALGLNIVRYARTSEQGMGHIADFPGPGTKPVVGSRDPLTAVERKQLLMQQA